MNFFKINPVFVGESIDRFHIDDLFSAYSENDTLYIIGKVQWNNDQVLTEGVIHVSNKYLYLYSITKDGIYSDYNFLQKFPIANSSVSLLSDSQIKVCSPDNHIDWLIEVPVGAYSLHNAIASVFLDEPLALLSLWCKQFQDLQYLQLLEVIELFQWSTVHKQIFLASKQAAREHLPPIPFIRSEFAFDISAQTIPHNPTFDKEITCLSAPKLDVEFEPLRDKNGYVIPGTDWAFDIRMNPFRRMVSIEVLNENRRVIEKGSGEIAVHCPRCDHLNKVTVNLADQRKLIADLNKKNIRTRKANDLQAKADRYRSLGAKWSGDLRGAREIDAVNSFNAAMTDRPRLYGQSDLTTNFSTKCRNCGNIADDY
jgi:hypothetical protein